LFNCTAIINHKNKKNERTEQEKNESDIFLENQSPKRNIKGVDA